MKSLKKLKYFSLSTVILYAKEWIYEKIIFDFACCSTLMQMDFQLNYIVVKDMQNQTFFSHKYTLWHINLRGVIVMHTNFIITAIINIYA